MTTAIERVTQALRTIVGHPVHNEARIRALFAPDYQQYVDGKQLDFADFVTHMATLKKLTRSMEVTLLAIASQQDEVLTHHRVAIRKRDGNDSEVEVFAHFTLQDGMIIRCEELTRLLQGAAEDRQLGSLQ